MTFKKRMVCLLCLILCASFAACKAEPKSNPADNPPASDLASGGAVSESGIDQLPATKSISISREGIAESLPAYLVSSNLGYSIYLFEDFVLSASTDGDIVQPALTSSSILPTIQMRIVHGDALKPLPQSGEKDGIVTEYRRIDQGALVFDAELSYPLEAAENAPVLLNAMLDTLTLTP